jgi:hypothetical protein
VRRRVFLGCAWLAAIGRLAGRPADDAQIWREYLDWYRRQPIEDSDTRGAYLAHLRRAGWSEADAEARARLVERLSRERRDEIQRLFFDRTYASPKPRFNTAPNALLVEAVAERRPGSALDVHMGQGRNAVFLAAKGWRVTGFDFSAEGVGAAPWLPRRNELLTIFAAFRILRYEDTLAPADWSWRPSRIARLVAEK